jgi:hypothetical protein
MVVSAWMVAMPSTDHLHQWGMAAMGDGLVMH